MPRPARLFGQTYRARRRVRDERSTGPFPIIVGPSSQPAEGLFRIGLMQMAESGSVEQTLESMVRNKADMDIIVVDDASTDNTCEVVEQYMHVHQNIRLLRSETNTGPGAPATGRSRLSIANIACSMMPTTFLAKMTSIQCCR